MAITSSALLPSFGVISSVVSNLIYEIIMLLPTNFLWPQIMAGLSIKNKYFYARKCPTNMHISTYRRTWILFMTS